MARRVSLQDHHVAIKCLEEDDGVIVINFFNIRDVEQVNIDVASFIDKIIVEVRLCFYSHIRIKRSKKD